MCRSFCFPHHLTVYEQPKWESVHKTCTWHQFITLNLFKCTDCCKFVICKWDFFRVHISNMRPWKEVVTSAVAEDDLHLISLLDPLQMAQSRGKAHSVFTPLWGEQIIETSHYIPVEFGNFPSRFQVDFNAGEWLGKYSSVNNHFWRSRFQCLELNHSGDRSL